MQLPLKDGTSWEPPQAWLAELAKGLPGVNIPAQLQKARLWLLGNPQRGKTRAGIKRFVTNWLSKSMEPPPWERAGPQTGVDHLVSQRCCRCNSRPATHPHNGNGYCIGCLMAVNPPTPARTDAVRIGDLFTSQPRSRT